MSDAHERYEVLLMKAVDGFAEPTELAELQTHTAECASCRAELAGFTAIKQTTDAMRNRILTDADIEPPGGTPAGRATEGFGVLAIVFGVLLLLGFALWELAIDPTVPLPVKLGTSAIAAGCLVLLLHFTRLRGRAGRRDPYREIDR